MAYEASMKQKKDAENIFSSAQRLGHDLGRAEGRVDVSVLNVQQIRNTIGLAK